MQAPPDDDGSIGTLPTENTSTTAPDDKSGDKNCNMAHALLAVAKVIAAWEAEVRATAEVWSQLLSAQAKWSAEGDERWSAMHVRLDSMQERLDKFCDDFREQHDQADTAHQEG